MFMQVPQVKLWKQISKENRFLELALPPNPSSANTTTLAASQSSLCVAGRGLAYMSEQGVGGGAKINNRKEAWSNYLFLFQAWNFPNTTHVARNFKTFSHNYL